MMHTPIFILALSIALVGCNHIRPADRTQEKKPTGQDGVSIDPVQAAVRLIRKKKWDAFLDIASARVTGTNDVEWVVSVVDWQAEAAKESPWIHLFSVEKASGKVTKMPID